MVPLDVYVHITIAHTCLLCLQLLAMLTCFSLRADPMEKEFLYPPLTFLQPESISPDGGHTVAVVTPQMA